MKSLSQMRREISNRPPADDLIQDLLPDSSSVYMLICGRSGIGKTFLALNVLFSLATGLPFLSHKTKPCKVGYLSMEGSDRKIQIEESKAFLQSGAITAEISNQGRIRFFKCVIISHVLRITHYAFISVVARQAQR